MQKLSGHKQKVRGYKQKLMVAWWTLHKMTKVVILKIGKMAGQIRKNLAQGSGCNHEQYVDV